MSEFDTISLPEFESLFKTHYGTLCGFANKYMDDLEASEEIVQSFFVKFWENRSNLKITTSVKSYIFTSVRNACLNQMKHIKIRETYKVINEREMEEAVYGVDDDYEATELDQKIRESIDALPEGRNRIFIMSRYEGLKYKEIADKLAISIKTVENQMGSAIKYMKAELAEYLVSLVLIASLIYQ